MQLTRWQSTSGACCKYHPATRCKPVAPNQLVQLLKSCRDNLKSGRDNETYIVSAAVRHTLPVVRQGAIRRDIEFKLCLKLSNARSLSSLHIDRRAQVRVQDVYLKGGSIHAIRVPRPAQDLPV